MIFSLIRQSENCYKIIYHLLEALLSYIVYSLSETCSSFSFYYDKYSIKII